MTNALDIPMPPGFKPLTIEDPAEDRYGAKQTWELEDPDVDKFPHGRIGRVKWLTKHLVEDDGTVVYLLEAVIVHPLDKPLGGMVSRLRMEDEDQSVILDHLMRLVIAYSGITLPYSL